MRNLFPENKPKHSKAVLRILGRIRLAALREDTSTVIRLADKLEFQLVTEWVARDMKRRGMSADQYFAAVAPALREPRLGVANLQPSNN